MPQREARLAAAGLAGLVLALYPAATEARCSRLDESCLHTGCCSTPKTSCYKKDNEAAFCRLDCKKGIHPDDPKKYRTPWSCEILTFGCNDAWKPCEGGKGQSDDVIPCCQWGCVCNYTSKYFHQCVPPEGENHCSKDGPQKIPDFARPKDQVVTDSSDDGGEEDEDADDDDSSSGGSPASSGQAMAGKNCFEVGGQMIGPDCEQDKSEALPPSAARAGALAGAGWRPSRLLLLAAGGSASAGVVAAAAGALLWRRRRAASHARHDIELSLTLSSDEDAS